MNRWRVVLVVLALVAFGWGVGHTQTQVGQFKIVVEPSATGMKATCTDGCAWKEVTFSCNGRKECKARIDERGVENLSK